MNKMKAIIVGCGRQGGRLAELLEAEDFHVVVIDNNPNAFLRLNPCFKGERVVGNGIDIDVLKKAGAQEAYAFAALTNGDNRNLMSAQIAKEVYKIPIVVCRVYDPHRANIYHDLGLQTVCSTTVGARMLRNLIISPKILRSYQLGNGNATAMEIKAPDTLKGKKIKEVEVAGEFRIACVIRNQEPHIPAPEFALEPGDQIILAARTDAMKKVVKALGVTEYAYNPQ